MPIGADVSAQYTEEAVGGGHPAKARVIDRLALVDHHVDGGHKGDKVPVHGQCRLTHASATQIKLLPFNGNHVLVKDADGWFSRAVPAAGVAADNAGLSASALYYAYLYDSAGALALELSAAAPAADPDTGVQVKAGDPTRTLVGMVYADASAQFQDGPAARHVLSHFNRRPLALLNAFTAGRTAASTSYAELHPEIQVSFLTWADEAVDLAVTGASSIDNAGAGTSTTIGIDSTSTPQDTFTLNTSSAAGQLQPVSLGLAAMLSEGRHYATVLGRVSASPTGTGTWSGSGTAGGRTTLTGVVKG